MPVIFFFIILSVLPFCLSGQLAQSKLPIFIIKTENGVSIPDEPKVAAHLGIIWNGDAQLNSINDPYNHYDGPIGIEVRGSSSQGFPKKNYAFETRQADGSNYNVGLLGFPKENDWVLHGPFSDKSLMRNAIAYILAGRLMEYAPRVKFCEVVINGNYQGVYILTEKIKRDKNRVNISPLNADVTSGDELTGGYILKFDKWDGAVSDGFEASVPPWPGSNGKTFYQYHYPKPDEITQVQKNCIRNFIFLMESTMNSPAFADPVHGYPKYFDLNSLIHFIFIQEISRNVDGYRLSTFFYKDRDSKDPRLKLGPVWDFNLGFGNVDYCIGPGVDGWAIDFNDFCPGDFWNIHFWWHTLWNDPGFQQKLCSRWNELRQGELSDEAVFRLVDSLTLLLQEPAQRNFQRWPVLNQYIWPNAFVGGSYSAEIQYLRNWLRDRLKWMDEEWNCEALDSLEPKLAPGVHVYPNPARESVTFAFSPLSKVPLQVEIYTLTGQRIATLQSEKGHRNLVKAIWNDPVPAGIYFYQIRAGGQLLGQGKVVRY